MERNRSDRRVPAQEAEPQGAEGALVLHTERSGESPWEEPSRGCENPRRFLRWLTHDGQLLPVRCGSPNRCIYCSWLTALENAYVVGLDAEDDCPRIGFTLTTKAAQTAPADFRESVAQAFRKLRSTYPGAEYLGMIEFTTGKGSRSGGARRIHQHGLLKGVPADQVQPVERILRGVWLRRTGAHRVEAHEIVKPAGAIAYLVNHHQKAAQTPPRGWTGKRIRPSRGYFASPIVDLRAEARWALAEKATRRDLAKWLQEAGAWEDLYPDELDDVITRSMQQRRALPKPELVRVGHVPSVWACDGTPSAYRLEVFGPVRD